MSFIYSKIVDLKNFQWSVIYFSGLLQDDNIFKWGTLY